MPLNEKPPEPFTVSYRVFSTVPWRQQNSDRRPFSRCAGAVGMVGNGRATGLGLPGPDVSPVWCLHPGSHSCGHPSRPPHRAHVHVPGAATEALWHQSPNLTSPRTCGPCLVAVLSSLEEWEGRGLPSFLTWPVLDPSRFLFFPPSGCWLCLLTLPWPHCSGTSALHAPRLSPLGRPVFPPNG